MSITYNKREVEKKRAQKRKDKQRRRDERRAESPSSFDDMIAYVDEFGNICDTPPEQRKREEIDVESILVSTPKREIVEEVRPVGRVNHYDEAKHYGFIRQNDGGDDLFFHGSNAYPGIQSGDMVSFDIERGQRGFNAIAVERVNTGKSAPIMQ